MLMEELLGYPAFTAGLVMALRGLASIVIAGRLINHVSSHTLIAVGITFSAFGSYFVTWYNLDINQFWLIWPVIIQVPG